ncbi:hypothetical protein [Actinoallomurus sp. NPDC050550]|uniref:hypothetical protein n=1 Tax=Actinoallomurus sp. NPDC050550 TaxID=3154937 RepID=UPI0033D3F7AD
MSEKFEKDPARGDAALFKMEDLSALIAKFGETFSDAFVGAAKILGGDDFGRQAWHQLNSQVLLLGQAVMAASECCGAVPHAFREQMAAADRAQQKVVDSINDVSAHNGQGLPGKGSGAYGK